MDEDETEPPVKPADSATDPKVDATDEKEKWPEENVAKRHKAALAKKVETAETERLQYGEAQKKAQAAVAAAEAAMAAVATEAAVVVAAAEAAAVAAGAVAAAETERLQFSEARKKATDQLAINAAPEAEAAPQTAPQFAVEAESGGAAGCCGGGLPDGSANGFLWEAITVQDESGAQQTLFLGPTTDAEMPLPRHVERAVSAVP